MASNKGISARVEFLAQPKEIPRGFIEDRRSIYFTDHAPIKEPAKGITQFALSGRLEDLALHRDVSSQYRGDKTTPIWQISKGALSANATNRIVSLAETHPVNRNYMEPRPVALWYHPQHNPLPAPNALSNLQFVFILHALLFGLVFVCSLISAKTRGRDSADVNEEPDCTKPITSVSPAALVGRCSGRIETLAEAKTDPPTFRAARSVITPVTDTAKNAIATLRLQQLARPRSVHDDRNYDPYIVSMAARNTHPTTRTIDLAAPLPRKVRTKKN